MNINPYILLGIGSFFAILYACVIIFGWAATRRNRRIVQREKGISNVDVWVLDPTCPSEQLTLPVVSLTANRFVDAAGNPIDISRYNPCVAVGSSPDFPDIASGDLVLKDKTGKVCYIFSVPNLANYR